MRKCVPVLLLVALLVAVTASCGRTGPDTGPLTGPLTGRVLYVDPDSPARRVQAADPADEVAAALAAVPTARWYTEDTPLGAVAAAVDGYVAGAAATGTHPVLVVYAVPGRDCGGFSAGGLAGADAYDAWIRQVRDGIGGRPATVVVEPDALSNLDCLPAAGQEARFAMLAGAVAVLGADPATLVYVDGGHSRWLEPAELARRLERVGVAGARGFSLNVSNFFATGEQQAYGEQVAQLLGGAAHYVVDTSRNGRGPAPDEPLNWCNPVGRAIGALPLTAERTPHDDGNLWIKHPGQSDGECDRGDPRSGLWFAERATEMVRNAAP